jgi:hypothetical protein
MNRTLFLVYRSVFRFIAQFFGLSLDFSDFHFFKIFQNLIFLNGNR